MPELTIEIGDIIGCRGKGWLSDAIDEATGSGGLSHIAVVTHIFAFGKIEVTEALDRVVVTPLAAVIAREKHVLLMKPPLTPEQRRTVQIQAAGMVGARYNYFDIVLQGLDALFKTRWFTHTFASSKFGRVCSWLAASLEPLDMSPMKPRDVSPNDFKRRADARAWPMEWLS